MISQATKNADFPGHSPAVPASRVCSNWVPGMVALNKADASVEITVPGSYDEATGRFVVTVKQNGSCEVAYDFTVQKELDVLQIGSVFEHENQLRSAWCLPPPARASTFLAGSHQSKSSKSARPNRNS